MNRHVELINLHRETERRRRELPAPALRRRIREDSGIPQSVVAYAVGVSAAAVSRWESGERNPRGRVLRRYSRLLEQLQHGNKTIVLNDEDPAGEPGLVTRRPRRADMPNRSGPTTRRAA